jgi:NAD(P)-dependent dehydrogenase (short-subunit alcohol dehydrogenase family)
MGQTIVITGCSSGFGRQAAEALAKKGHRVYATMRGADGKNRTVATELRELAKGSRLDLFVLELDVASDTSVEKAAKQVLSESGGVDVLINNAGQMFVGVAELFDSAELSEQLDINVVGVHRLNRAFLPTMRQRGSGLIINISSIAGRMGIPFYAIYHASKWALEGYSLAMRTELASSGIDVVVVEPGPFSTALFPMMRSPKDQEGRAASYPSLVHETFATLGKTFEGIFEDASAPTDPRLVVDCMVDLVERAPGTRPFRSVVGLDFGVRDRNATAEPHDQALLDATGLKSFATLKQEAQ